MNSIEQAIQLMDSGLTEKAIEQLRTLLIRAGDDEKYDIGILFMQWGLLNDAEPIFVELNQNYPDDVEFRLILAEIYTEWEDDDKAFETLRTIEPESDFYVQSLIQLADLYQSQGLFEVAEQKLMEAKRLEPSEKVLDLALAELAFSSGEYGKSIPFYEKILGVNLDIPDIDVSLRLAEAYAMTGSFEKALDQFEQSDQDSPDVLFRYGFTAYKKQMFDRAIQVWKQLVDIDPDYHSVYPMLSEAYEEEGLVKEAYDTAKQGIERDTFNQKLFYHTGTLANRLGNVNEAEALIKEAIALDPGYKEAIMYLIELYKQVNKDEELIDLVTEVIRFGEEDPMYFWERARAYNRLEKFSYALNDYQEAYNAFKGDLEFLKEYGYFLLEEGRLDSASAIFQSYLKDEPTDIEIHELVERISRGEAN